VSPLSVVEFLAPVSHDESKRKNGHQIVKYKRTTEKHRCRATNEISRIEAINYKAKAHAHHMVKLIITCYKQVQNFSNTAPHYQPICKFCQVFILQNIFIHNKDLERQCPRKKYRLRINDEGKLGGAVVEQPC